MLNCKDVSKLLSESLDRKLPFWTRMGLWMHLSMCRLCWGFRKDLLHIHSETRLHASEIERDAHEANGNLSEESRKRMKQLLTPPRS
ncbi:MAG: hypothetical protein AB7O59_08225 [Pirellulales bacterium]